MFAIFALTPSFRSYSCASYWAAAGDAGRGHVPRGGAVWRGAQPGGARGVAASLGGETQVFHFIWILKITLGGFEDVRIGYKSLYFFLGVLILSA